MSLQQYLAVLKEIELLSREEETELWQACKERDDFDARRRLIEQYQPLVFKAAMQWRLDSQLLLDVIQEGTVGLIEAVEKYDHRRGVAFSLYALHRIRGRMLNYLASEGKQANASLDLPSEDGSLTLADCLVDTAPQVAAQVENGIMVETVKQALARLPEKEMVVLQGVFLENQEAKQLADSMELSLTHIYRLQKQGIKRIRGILSKFMQHW